MVAGELVTNVSVLPRWALIFISSILAFVLLPLLLLRKLTNADVCKDEGVIFIIMHFVGMVYFRWRFSDRRVKIEKLYLLGVPVHQSSCLAHPRPGNYLFGWKSSFWRKYTVWLVEKICFNLWRKYTLTCGENMAVKAGDAWCIPAGGKPLNQFWRQQLSTRRKEIAKNWTNSCFFGSKRHFRGEDMPRKWPEDN